jgi:hypothetical protein
MSLLSTGTGNISGNKLCVIADSERLALLCIVILAERNDVPAIVGGVVLLNVCSYFDCSGAIYNGAR